SPGESERESMCPRRSCSESALGCLLLFPSDKIRPGRESIEEASPSVRVRKLKLREGTNTAVLFGQHDRHLKLIEEELGVRLSARGEELTLDGQHDATRHAERVLTELAALANDGMVLQPEDITHALTALRHSPDRPIKELLST